MDNNISFSKIVATPTLTSWSQAYNAGKLFAVLSLEEKEGSEIESLNMLGKELLERLEKEFFVIENKNLETIRKAVGATFETIPSGLRISFAAGAFVGNILYLFGFGNSKVFIKRNGVLGVILEASENQENIFCVSGYTKENDIVVLGTEVFAKIFTQDELNNSLANTDPTEITEILAPKVHKAEDGKISAIIIKCNPTIVSEADEIEGLSKSEEVIDDERIEPEETRPLKNLTLASRAAKYLNLIKSKIPNLRLRSSRKIFLALAATIVLVLALSVFFAIREQNNAKTRALFADIYPQALKKYDEGQGLIELNRNFARDSFIAAEKIIKDNIKKFPAKSKEEAQSQDLLRKIEEGLAAVSPTDKSGLDRSTLSITVTNGSGIEGVAGKASLILKNFGYNVASTGNADKFDYEGVTIKIKKEKAKFLDLLKKDLSKDYVIKASTSDLSSTSSTDALVIIGK